MNLRVGLILAGLAASAISCTQKMALQGRGSVGLIRVPPEGTIAKGDLRRAARPAHWSLDLLKQGQVRFNTHCSPCHGYSGYGDGMVVQRGFLAPPSYHTDRLRKVSDQHIFDVITHGFGAMYSYADHLTEEERWTVVGYIRALQLSQNPPEEKTKRESR